MTTPLNILIVEDSADDAALLARELKSAGFDPKWKRVETEADYLAALQTPPDVIISDFQMPFFSGLRAAQLLRESGLNIPFILVSAMVGEEAAVEAMRQGATDYLLKDRIARLGNAVERALEQHQLRAGQKRAEEQIYLQANALEAAANAILITDRSGKILSANSAFCAMTGYSREEVLGKAPRFLKSGKYDSDFYRNLWQTVLAGRVWRGEMTNRRKDGSLYHEEMTITPVRGSNGEVTHFIAVKQDITEHKKREETLNLFRMLVDRSNDGIEVIEPETGRFLDINERTCLRLGYTRDELLSMTVLDVDPLQVDLNSWHRNVEEIRRAGFRILEGRHRRKDGSTFPIEINVCSIKLDREYLIAAVRDITERKEAEKWLRESEEKFRQLAENINEVFWMTDASGHQILYVSPAYEKIWGRTCESLYASSLNWIEAIHPDDRARVIQSYTANQATGTYEEEYRIVRPDKSIRWIRDRSFPVRNQAGEIERVVGVAADITEKRKLEEEFRQSQKMEAIGQLAGGVAHDFNNILAVILMQTNFLSAAGGLSPEQQESAAQIGKAAMFAANLTRQLLLFSRRQTMQPRDLDLNDSIAEIGKMLRRALGEDIKLHLKHGSRPALIHADAGMIDQVLMNLAVNSRDAMPKGGELAIETSVVEFDALSAAQSPSARPGSFACLSVSDTGCGIAPDVLPRVFDPFFTTKDVGKGTGLGLATVFSIVQQHKGWINVYSEPGQGTTFRLYFPRLAKVIGKDESPHASAPVPGGNESILLVEDDASLRPLIEITLTRLGYRVLTAASGIKALKVWAEHHQEIQLLLTDLVMPEGMNGRELADKLLQDNPKLKVVYTSGYSAEVLGRNFPIKEGVNFLTKPFEVPKLAQTLRNCLSGG